MATAACSPWAARLALEVQRAAAARPTTGSLFYNLVKSDVCLVQARAAEEASELDELEQVAADIACAVRLARDGPLRSLTIVVLEQGALGPKRTRLDASLGTSSARRRSHLEEQWALRAASRIAPAVAAHSPGHQTAVRVFLSSEAPTVRLLGGNLPRARCGLLVLRADGHTANLRQSIRIDLPHVLFRLAAPNGIVVASSATPCPPKPPFATATATSRGAKGRSARVADNTSRYVAVFGGRPVEQCWADRWRDLTDARTLRPLAPRTSTATTADARADAAHVMGNSSECEHGLWCAARLVGRSACERRPPLLAANATRHLVSVGHETTRQQLHRSLRYFSAIDCEAHADGRPIIPGVTGMHAPGSNIGSNIGSSIGSSVGNRASRAVCLIFKDDVQETWIGGLAARDGLAFSGAPILVYPKHSKRWAHTQQGVMTHNLAIARSADTPDAEHPTPQYTIMGGTHRNRALSGAPHRVNAFHQGVWLARGGSWAYDPTSNISLVSIDKNGVRVPAYTQWAGKRIALRGDQSGCVERRDRTRMPWIIKDTCEFDGRLALVDSAAHGGLLLYARANLASHGQRFVQVTRSPDGGATWRPFQTIRIDGYEPSQGDGTPTSSPPHH